MSGLAGDIPPHPQRFVAARPGPRRLEAVLPAGRCASVASRRCDKRPLATQVTILDGLLGQVEEFGSRFDQLHEGDRKQAGGPPNTAQCLQVGGGWSGRALLGLAWACLSHTNAGHVQDTVVDGDTRTWLGGPRRGRFRTVEQLKAGRQIGTHLVGGQRLQAVAQLAVPSALVISNHTWHLRLHI